MAARLRLQCTKCGLAETRFSIVQGRGKTPADILFIGEAPGTSEDLNGEAFIGKAGKLLDKMIDHAENMALVYNLKYYFSNIVFCRPTEYLLGPNREPTKLEIVSCQKNIIHMYELVNPKIVIFVGKIAYNNYKKIFKMHEQITHPAALLRQGGIKSPFYLTNVRKIAEVFAWLQD